MEKNTVLLSVDKYNELLRQLFKDHNASIQNELECDELKERYQALIDFAIERCIFKYYLANRSLEELTDATSTFFAISREDFKKLTSLGIHERRIVSVIKRVKKQCDEEHKGDKE